MLTLSEIENISFREVSRFSFIKGYVCADVDNFVDEVTETVKSLENKIAELEALQKVVDEYTVMKEYAQNLYDAFSTMDCGVILSYGQGYNEMMEFATVQLALIPFTVLAVMMAEPGVTAVITPFSTVAVLSSLLVQVIV